MRPSPGTVPKEGQVPAPPRGPRRELSLIGPVAREVGDLRLALTALDDGLVESLPTRCLWTPGEGSLPVRADVAAAVERAATALADAGVSAEERRPDGLEQAEALYSRWRTADDLADLRELARGREDRATPYVRWLFEMVGEAQQQPGIAVEAAQLGQRVSDQLADAVLVLPVALTPAVPHDATEVDVAGQAIDVNGMKLLGPSRAISVLRLPAVAVPAGKSKDGLPVGVQVVGPPGADGTVLAAAAVIERDSAKAVGH